MSHYKNRIAIVEGFRTPIAKASGKFNDLQADALGSVIVKELLSRSQIDKSEFDEVIVGNVASPAHAPNIAKIIATRSGFDFNIPAFSVNRNCASGMEAITSAANKIKAGEANIILAAATESMSNTPLLFSKHFQDIIMRFSHAKNAYERIKILSTLKFSDLRPVVALFKALKDPTINMNMGQTAEVLAREFHISRESQDEYALMSHTRASIARFSGVYSSEIIPVIYDDSKILDYDDGVREGQSIASLEKLKGLFTKEHATVTAGNASQISDGAAAVSLMSESEAKKRGFNVLGYLRDYTYVGVPARRMGLGPVYATAKILKKSGLKFSNFELIEMNEAFAAQVIANEIAFGSKEFASEYLGLSSAIGEINRDILNVNGGAIAMGHPVGMSGMRIVIHLLKQMRLRNLSTGLATLCVGGGQGAALILEVE